ncbi:MAG: hypothetical protein ACK58L_10205 [Planctomycetota bacterium]
MEASPAGLLSNITLARLQRSRVKDLRGFRKTHQVPSEFNEHTNGFVGRIASEELSEDLDLRFAEFRRALGFRRVDMNVSEPDGGVGTIVTPWFEYQISAGLASDDPAEVIWRRQLSDFRQPEMMFETPVATAFGNLFDTVELLPASGLDVAGVIDQMEAAIPDGVTLDYDRTATWCLIGIKGVAGQVRLTADLMSLVVHQPQSPGKLLDSFRLVRNCFRGIEGF